MSLRPVLSTRLTVERFGPFVPHAIQRGGVRAAAFLRALALAAMAMAMAMATTMAMQVQAQTDSPVTLTPTRPNPLLESLTPGDDQAILPRQAPSLVLHLTRAQFTAATAPRASGQVDGASSATGSEEVDLPDTWAARELAPQGRGTYRLGFVLPEQPATVWAIRFERLAERHEIRLNGELVSGRLDPVDSAPSLSNAVPAWVTLPPQLLLRGHNELLIHVEHTRGGGLSSVWLGPEDALREVAGPDDPLVDALPLLLNGAGLALSALMLLTWRARRESTTRAFAAVWLLLSLVLLGHALRNPGAIGATLDGLLYAGEVGSGVLAMLWLIDLCQRHAPSVALTRGRAAVLVIGVALTLAGIPATELGEIDTLRRGVYPAGIALLLAALALLWRALRGQPRRSQATTWAIWLALLGAGGHDLLVWRGDLSVLASAWLPLVLPLLCAGVGWQRARQLGQALQEVESLNRDLERRVAERTREVEQAHQAKTRFLSAASHDLRQPVVTIGLLIDLLRDQIQAPGPRRMIDRVNAAVASMEELLNGLLDLSRLEAGTVQPRIEVIELQALFDGIAPHEIEAAQRKGLRLRLRPTTLAVHSDRVLLGQVLRNLVSNALRYTDQGGVLVVARRHGTQVRLQVWDTGNGIAADEQERVFEEFVQGRQHVAEGVAAADARAQDPASSPAGSGHGLGLGLAIVRSSVRLLGHRLGLRSESGRGTCFTLTLPMARAQAAPVPALPVGEHPLAGWRIALVEDDDRVREAVAARLQAWGAAVDAHAGLQSLRQRLALRPRGSSGIDLLVTDQRLNGATGLDVIEAVRSYGGPVPALVITGDTAPADLARLAASRVTVLHKPFRAEALLAAILPLRVRSAVL